MKIKTKTTIRVGKGRDAKYQPPGEYDIDDAVAKDLIASGAAEAVDAPDVPPEGDPETERSPAETGAKGRK